MSERLAVLRGVESGIGATALAAEYAHRHRADYPGGAIWVPYRVSTQQGLAADIIEIWRSSTDSVHVLGITRPGEPVPDDCVFEVERPNAAATERALENFGATSLPTTISSIPALLSIALPLVAGGHAATAFTAPLDIVREAIGSLSDHPRRLLGVLSLLDIQPVPAALLDAIFGHVDVSDSPAPWRSSLGSLVETALAISTTLGEPRIHERILPLVREVLHVELDALHRPVVEGLLDQLRTASPARPHSSRRLVPHTYAVLTSDLGSHITDELVEQVIEIVSIGTSDPLAVIAARMGISSAESAGDLRRKLRYQTVLGHTFSQMRQLDDAQRVLREALATAEQAHGSVSLEVAEVIDHLERAMSLGVCGDAGPEALAFTERAHAIREAVWGSDDPRLRGSLANVAINLAVRERHAEALTYYERALRLAEPCGPQDAYLLQEVAMTLAENGRFDAAMTMIDRVFALETPNGFSGFGALLCTERILEKANRADRLLAYVERVLDGAQGPTDEEHVCLRGRVLGMRAAALVAAGRATEAPAVASEALAILERFYGADEQWLAGLRNLRSGP